MASMEKAQRGPTARMAAFAAGAVLISALVGATLSCAHEQARNQGGEVARGQGGMGGPPPDGQGPGGQPPNSGGSGGSGKGAPPSGGQGGPGSTRGKDDQSGANTRIAATYSLIGKSAAKSNQDYRANGGDTTAVYVAKAGALQLSNSIIDKQGDSSNEETSNFYGLNAAFLAASGAKAALADVAITTEGSGSNAIVATGSGTKVVARILKIRTSANSSRGLHATMGGSIEATDVDIATLGDHSAAIATDRGGGRVVVTRGSASTEGKDSPGIYSTGDIRVSGAAIKAAVSEGAVIEGKNSISLVDTALSGAKKCGVMLYQSTSGDAAEGTAEGTARFAMVGGSLDAKAGPLFYVTNAKAEVSLRGVKAETASGILAKAAADRWGKKGSNGGELLLLMENQALSGDVIAESGSSVSIELTKGSTLEGRIDGASLSLGEGCSWKIGADSRLAALCGGDPDELVSRIVDGGRSASYDAKLPENAPLGGKTYLLPGGGKLMPFGRGGFGQ